MSPSRRVVHICYWWFITLFPLVGFYSGCSAFPQPRDGHVTQATPMEQPPEIESWVKRSKGRFLELIHPGSLAQQWLVPATEFPRAVTVPAVMKQDSVAFSSVLWAASCPPARCFSVYASSGCFLWPTTKNILTTSPVSQAEAEFDLGETQHQNFLQRSRGNWLTD